MIPTVAVGDVHDLLIRLLVTVVAAIDMETRAIEMGKAWAQGPSAVAAVAAMRL